MEAEAVTGKGCGSVHPSTTQPTAAPFASVLWLPTMPSSCPHSFIFAGDYAAAQAVAPAPLEMAPSPAIHFQLFISSWGESCGSWWVCAGCWGTVSLIPGGLRNHRPGLALPSPVWPTVTSASEPSRPASCTTQTEQLTCGCLLVFMCSLFSQRGFSSSKWPNVSHLWCRSFP